MTRSAIALAIVAVRPAVADTPRVAPTEIEVDRADAPPGRTELGFDGGAPVGDWAITLASGWLERPITFGLAGGGTTEPVRRRQTVVLGGAIALGDSVVADARVAGAHQTGARLLGAGDSARKLDRWVPSDLRLGARIRVRGDERAGAVFLRADLALPTGDAGDFAGDASWSLAWRLIGRLAVGDTGVVAAGTVGLRLRGEEVIVGDRLVGNELVGAAGVVVPIPALRPLWCPEQVFVTGELAGVIGDDVGATRGPSPLEGRFGMIVRPRRAWAIGLGAAFGLVDEIGAPALRATVEITYRGGR